jgi:hypothetical protein
MAKKSRIKFENGRVYRCLGYTYDGKPSGWLDITESYKLKREREKK